jgi:hypothetical protein
MDDGGHTYQDNWSEMRKLGKHFVNVTEDVFTRSYPKWSPGKPCSINKLEELAGKMKKFDSKLG